MIKYIIALAVLWFLYRISAKKDEKGKEAAAGDKKPAGEKKQEKK